MVVGCSLCRAGCMHWAISTDIDITRVALGVDRVSVHTYMIYYCLQVSLPAVGALLSWTSSSAGLWP